MDDLFDHRTVPEYNTRAVVNRTGVPADTFRAWERRHGLPRPARTKGNHRLYSERDIAIISSLKHMTAEGVSISHAIVRTRRLLGLDRSLATTSSNVSPAELEVIRQHLLSAITNFDASHADTLIEDAMVLVDVETLCVDILQPVLVEIGDRWVRGEINVSIEHFCTSFCMRKLAGFFNASQPDFGNSTIICACAAEEHHEIGLMMLSIFLSRIGYRVIYLGANMPAQDLVDSVRRIGPDAVALASTTDLSLPHLMDAIEILRCDFDAGVLPIIGFGGAIFEREPVLRNDIDAHYLGADARIACRRIDEIISTRALTLSPSPASTKVT